MEPPDNLKYYVATSNAVSVGPSSYFYSTFLYIQKMLPDIRDCILGIKCLFFCSTTSIWKLRMH